MVVVVVVVVGKRQLGKSEWRVAVIEGGGGGAGSGRSRGREGRRRKEDTADETNFLSTTNINFQPP